MNVSSFSFEAFIQPSTSVTLLETEILLITVSSAAFYWRLKKALYRFLCVVCFLSQSFS